MLGKNLKKLSGDRVGLSSFVLVTRFLTVALRINPYHIVSAGQGMKRHTCKGKRDQQHDAK